MDFVVEAVPERIEIKRRSSPSSMHAHRARDPCQQHLLAVDHRDGHRHQPTRQVVGFHYFYPASVMRLIEVIEGEESSEETLQSTVNFAQQIRKIPIRCAEAPGFVVNRILNSAASEIWRYKDETGLSVQEIDKEVADAKVAPMGPSTSAICSASTRFCTSRIPAESYGDRFYVSPEMKELVGAGNFGPKTGKGFYDHGGS